MHFESRAFTLWAKRSFPNSFRNVRVLDVGSGDINGNNRFLFEDCEYHGNDVAAAPNVTVVSRTKDLPFEDASFDTVISTECFEHDPDIAESLATVYRLLKPGGIFCFTCASTGRPEHGTLRTTPNDSVGTASGVADMKDYYRNVELDDLREMFTLNDDFSAWTAWYNALSHDLYFLGIKQDRNRTPSIPEYTAPGVTCSGSWISNTNIEKT